MNIEILQIAAVAGAMSAATGLLMLWAWMRLARREAAVAEPGDAAVFLFDGDDLVDATQPARRILALSPGSGPPRHRLIGALRQRFPGIDAAIDDLMPDREVSLATADGMAALDLRAADGRLAVTLREGTGSVDAGRDPAGVPEPTAMTAFEDELLTLRTITEAAPIPIWRETPEGRVTWVNAAYLDLVMLRHGGSADRCWPLPKLFDTPALHDDPDAAPSASRRIGLPATDTVPAAWYDCHIARIGQEVLVSAVNVDDVVRAEVALREFVQTLSKTFADLAVGLAVFGKDRRLAMFNPALTDLTTLPVPVLLGRPSLVAFLDALRGRRMIPEPKDYRSWRERIATLEAEISDGTLSETWHLPSERTYRVTARPQPDGALAMLFEDVSAEIRLTRLHRGQIASIHAVIDALPDAIAVFDAGGIMTLTNRAHDDLWGGNSREGLGDVTVRDAVRRWAGACPPNPMWDDVVAWATGTAERAAWAETIRLGDGRAVAARFTPLPGGAAMASFARVPAAGAETPAARPAAAAGAEAVRVALGA